MIKTIKEHCKNDIMNKYRNKINEYESKINLKKEQNATLEIRNKEILVETEKLKKDNATLGAVLALVAKKSFDKNLIKLQREYVDNEDIIKQNIIDIHDIERNYQEYMDNVVNKEIKNIDDIHSIRELGYSLLTIMKDCLVNKIPFCLDGSDKQKIISPDNDKSINYFEEMVFTYKTNDIIKYNQINSDNKRIKLGINHENDNDSNNKYGVILFTNRDLLDDAIGVNDDDIYFEKKIQMRGGYLLCPKSEYEEILSLNEDMFVVPYDDDRVDGYINQVLYELEYPIIKGNVLSKIDFKRLVVRGIEKSR